MCVCVTEYYFTFYCVVVAICLQLAEYDFDVINNILDIVNQIKSQISSSVLHLSSGLAGIRTLGLDRHIVL
jgi:hypothetical protein